jgi:hypothetical protein
MLGTAGFSVAVKKTACRLCQCAKICVITSVMAHGYSEERFLKVGSFEINGPVVDMMGLESSLEVDRIRWFIDVRSPGFIANGYIGINFGYSSFAYHRDDDWGRFSLNPLFLLPAMVTFLETLPDTNESFLDFGGWGTLITLTLLPQILTNCSIRADVLPQRLGFMAGPRTDYVVAQGSLQVRTEVHGGFYWTLPNKFNFDGTYSSALSDGHRRIHARFSMVFPE